MGSEPVMPAASHVIRQQLCMGPEKAMRITVHLDAFDRINPCANAILWLDDASLKWSREAHVGLTLPEWGRLCVEANNTLVCGQFGDTPICALEGLELRKHGGPFEGEIGRAHWYGGDEAKGQAGHWHVQCVEEQCTKPESGIFADDEAA
jgi:hypothetical protein